MDALSHLLAGFAAALSVHYLLYAFAGCMLGTLIGLLPGLGPAAGTAILIPLTFSLDATGSIIMLCAIYYGAMYGGTITSVLINVPGEAASVVTCIDGHQMARQGRAGSALGIAAIGSFVGGTLATVALVAVAMPLASLALKFGPAEFFALMVAGLCLVVGLAGRNMLAALLMASIGLLLAMIGVDPVRGAPRFTFGVEELFDGIGFVPVVMGLFGIAELLIAAEARQSHMVEARLANVMPTREECRASAGAIGRGTVIGFVLGLIPGVGAIVPTFMAYVLEKRVSKTPERFGKGAIEGVASAETANNAYANASMVPLLALGIPSSPTIAVLMGAFIVNGITPGPFLFTERPELVWTVIASFFVGNVLLLILNLPLVGLWAKLLKIPFSYMCAGVLIFCIIGAYGLKQNLFDVWVMLGFGILGYLLRKLDFPIAPAILALILGPMMERSLRTTLEISGGSLAIFLDRPLALALLAVPVIVVATLILKPGSFSKLRESDAE
ncbi:tripartite tricarboxylate transporter permease [Reyranella sp.]|uniref:tripartite tricarboxylate transporter permease n=1 Tax=Reyranella sp. TaxID=1929291 RepID=UPI0037831325